MASKNYDKNRFVSSCENWLSKPFLTEYNIADMSSSQSLDIKPNVGWPFLASVDKKLDGSSRAMETSKLANEFVLELLILAAAYKARKENKPELRYVLLESIKTSHSAFDLKNSYLMSQSRDKASKLSSDEALGLILTTYISREAYQQIRNVSKNHIFDFLPSYREVRNSKKKCYPERIKIEEADVEVNLEDCIILQIVF